MNDDKTELRYAPQGWGRDEYNDFFNASLSQKRKMVEELGVPTFEGYEAALEAWLPGSAEDANFKVLWNAFSKLNEFGKGVAMGRVLEIAETLEFREFPPVRGRGRPRKK